MYKLLKGLIAGVWLVNGLVCKVLDFVPRHEQIVASILSDTHSRTLTVLIGLSEIAMSIWILSKIKPRLNTVIQIVIVACMNIIEFILVPDLLLWGRFNIIIALIFISIVFYNEFVLRNKMEAE